MTTTCTPVIVQATDKVYSFPDDAAAQTFETSVKEAGGKTLRLAPIPPPLCRPLYDLEAHLAALIETEDVVPEDQHECFAVELQEALLTTAEKRDRVGQFMAYLESQSELAKTEIDRLQARRALFSRAYERMELYVTRVINSLGFDAKGKRKKLEGNTITLALHGCDKRVEYTDEAAVPAKYKRVTVTMPVETWTAVLDSLDLDLRAQVLDEIKRPQIEVSASLVKADLKADIAVPGAQFAGGHYLVIN